MAGMGALRRVERSPVRVLMFVLVVVVARWLEVGWPPGLGLLVDMGCFLAGGDG